MAELKYEIVENLGSLGENARGWSKEVNLISWNEKEPKYDIRDCFIIDILSKAMRFSYD